LPLKLLTGWAQELFLLRKARVVQERKIRIDTMAIPNATCNIEKLTDTNYESWKIQMRSVLVVNLWGYVNGEIVPIEASQAEWKQKDRKALALITLHVARACSTSQN